jgi:glutathione peroxidase
MIKTKLFAAVILLAAMVAFMIPTKSARAVDPATQPSADAAPATQPAVPPVLAFKMKSLAGKDVDLSKYQGRVLLIVNTASKCGFTPQYAGLEQLHEKYADKGLSILGFPANNFGHQEPGTDVEISTFCMQNYGVKFDMFSKISVLGDDQTPLYKLLTTTAPETGDVQWNFEKFLVSRKGVIVARYRSAVTPESDEIVKAIEAELAK